MEELMQFSLFVLGVLLAVGGLGCFVLITIRGAQHHDGLTLQIGKFSMDVKAASIAVIVIGAALSWVGYASAAELDSRQEEIAQKSRAVDRVKSFSGAILRETLELVTPNQETEAASPERYAALESIQEQLFRKLSQASSNPDFSLSLLQALSTDSFGRIKIPEGRLSELESILEEIVQNFPENSLLLFETADAYRSLYEATREPRYRERWRELAEAALDEAETKRERYAPSNLLGVYYTSENQFERALDYLAKAEENAPSGESHKVSFNLCNAHFQMNEDKAAIDECHSAVAHARDAGVPFWQPRYTLGLLALRAKDLELAASFFADAGDIAEQVDERPLVESYLFSTLDRKVVADLCANERFYSSFRSACEATPR